MFPNPSRCPVDPVGVVGELAGHKLRDDRVGRVRPDGQEPKGLGGRLDLGRRHARLLPRDVAPEQVEERAGVEDEDGAGEARMWAAAAMGSCCRHLVREPG